MSKDRHKHKSRQPPKKKPTEITIPSAAALLLWTLPILLVLAVVLVTYWPALSAQTLAFDDDQYLVNNPLVQNPSWASTCRFLGEVLKPSTVKGYYQPLSMISLMLDYAFGGRPDNLLPFHITSLALHIFNTLSVIILLYLLFGNTPAAVAVGLLFGVHPLTVEPIPWVAERKTLLATCLALWSLIAYLRYTKKKSPTCYGASVLMCILALMAKPTSIQLPFLMLLLDYWPLKRLSKKAILEKIPFFLIIALFGTVIFLSQSTTFGVRMPGEQGLTRIILILCHNNILYLTNMVWPANLSLFYPFPQPMNLTNTGLLIGVVGTLVLILLLLASLCRARALLTGWLFFFVAILPTMGIVGFHDMIAADRHTYLPFLGILMALAYLLTRIQDTAAKMPKSVTLQVSMLVCIAILAALEIMSTRKHLAYWQDTETHRRRMLALAPNQAITQNSLAIVLADRDKLDEAIMLYKQALKLKSNIASVVHHNLAGALKKQKQFHQAVIHYKESIKLKPDNAHTHRNLGLLWADLKEFNKAVECYQTALKINPQFAKAHYNLGVALFQLGQLDKAIQHFRQVLEIHPQDAEMHCNLGVLLAKKGQTREAIKQFRTALKFYPNLERARKHLQAALAKQTAPASH
ncbi:MAG: tetratricopeptide repeat protein [Planctomycetota bacterium]|jgi:tetratricopeptide (TPR) repeat protein